MATLFGGGPSVSPAQKPVVPPPAPVRDDQTILGAAMAERQRVAALAGRGSTILGNAAAYAAAPNAQRTTLGVG